MAPSPLSTRPLYSKEQIHRFYDRISLPQKHRHDPGPSTNNIHNDKDASLALLSALQRHFLASVPFENLDLHYSPHHSISLDPAHLFDKIVLGADSHGHNRGRGGYCMENNQLLNTVLASLGFDVVSVGARVNAAVGNPSAPADESSYSGWSHMVNLVTVPARSGTKYQVDVGFGHGGPTAPIPLEHGIEVLNVAPKQMVRLRYDSIADNTSTEQKLWIYEMRDGEGKEFRPCYCFGETVFLPADYAVMNLATSQARTSWFTQAVVCVKFLLAEDDESIVGDVTLFERSVKRRVGGRSEKLMESESEEDRVLALERYLDVRLSEAQRNGIKGMVSAIK